MCGIGLMEAVKEINDPLTMDADAYLNDDFTQSKHYVWERTCVRPKKTCSKACGYNYSSWLRTQDPKSSYTKKIFDCFKCGKTSEGGRVVISGKYKKYICRHCARKQTTSDLRHLWEVFNLEHRQAYAKEYRRKHKKHLNTIRRNWRERRKLKGLPYT